MSCFGLVLFFLCSNESINDYINIINLRETNVRPFSQVSSIFQLTVHPSTVCAHFHVNIQKCGHPLNKRDYYEF